MSARPALAVLAAALLVSPALAQVAERPATAPAGPAAPASSAAPAAAPPAPEAYSYDPQGRRDPFVSLLQRGSDHRAGPGERRPTGIAGLPVGELSVRGVMRSQTGYVAILQGPDGKTYIAHQSDRLLDGTIKSITEQGLVILQEVSDPLSLVKQKEVRKGLRAFDEGK